jgi:hypothetical protein
LTKWPSPPFHHRSPRGCQAPWPYAPRGGLLLSQWATYRVHAQGPTIVLPTIPSQSHLHRCSHHCRPLRPRQPWICLYPCPFPCHSHSASFLLFSCFSSRTRAQSPLHPARSRKVQVGRRRRYVLGSNEHLILSCLQDLCCDRERENHQMMLDFVECANRP